MPTLGKEVFAECQGCGTRQSWKKMLQKQPLPQFCRVPQPGTRQRGQFCRVPGGTTRQRLFLKRFFFKKWFLCRVLSPGSRQKFKFCRVPVPRHSAKPASNVDGSYFFTECGLGTRQRLCRVSIFGTLTKKFLPIKSLPRDLCRVRHSAKPLPSAWLALPSAPSTRQRGRLQLCKPSQDTTHILKSFS